MRQVCQKTSDTAGMVRQAGIHGALAQCVVVQCCVLLVLLVIDALIPWFSWSSAARTHPRHWSDPRLWLWPYRENQ